MSLRLIADIVAGNLISSWLRGPSEQQIAAEKLKHYRPPCVLRNLGECISPNSRGRCVCLKMEKDAYTRACSKLVFASQFAGQTLTPEQSVTVNKAIDDATEEATSIARYDNFIIWFWRGVLIIFAAVVVISLIRKYS